MIFLFEIRLGTFAVDQSMKLRPAQRNNNKKHGLTIMLSKKLRKLQKLHDPTEDKCFAGPLIKH